jgi:hypothetical protein
MFHGLNLWITLSTFKQFYNQNYEDATEKK